MKNEKRNNIMITVCNVCTMTDSKQSNGDVDFCNDCYATEQGFRYLKELDNGTFEDEDGNLFDSDFELIS